MDNEDRIAALERGNAGLRARNSRPRPCSNLTPMMRGIPIDAKHRALERMLGEAGA